PQGHLALAATLHGITVWDLDHGEKLRSFDSSSQDIEGMALSADGRLALSASGGPFARTLLSLTLWDVPTGKPLANLVGHDDSGVYDVAFSPDGRLALSTSSDETIRLWDFSRPAAYLDLERRGRAARSNLLRHPDQPWASRVLGEWYAFRGVNDWAVELLDKARAGG